MQKEGCSQLEVDYSFKTIVVHGASEPEIATVQDFLNRCHKRQYISVTLNVRASLEKQDRKAF